MDQSDSGASSPQPVVESGVPLSSSPSQETPFAKKSFAASVQSNEYLLRVLKFLRTVPNVARWGMGGVLVILVALVFFRGSINDLAFFVPTQNYVPVYQLVNDKISENGAIVINLPEGVSKEGATSRVIFEPAIQGEWVESSFPEAIVYKPASELKLGNHYLVSLAVDEEGSIQKDFIVDEDPAIVDIFPSNKAEADESSAITIVFNRPMVPLTTLSELESKAVPVVITPNTKGKFKWITTRTLQFIPETILAGSANYTVEVKEGFVSMDGLTVPPKTHTFFTRKLALKSKTEKSIIYSQPIEFRFNQAVDLEKTRPEITVKNETDNTAIRFTASYGKKKIYERGKLVREIDDTSVISILPEDSLRGRSHVWDFAKDYSVSIREVFPVGGDMRLSGSMFGGAVQTRVTSSPLIYSVKVESEKTTLAGPELFDPAGKVYFSLYDDVDLRKSTIRAKGLKTITHGTSCVRDPNDRRGSCKQKEDRKVLVVTFKEDVFSRGEVVDVVFEKVVNTDGFTVNASPITSLLKVYPELKIFSFHPSGGKSASLKEFTICTSVPIQNGDAKVFRESVQANGYMVFGRWMNPFLVSKERYGFNPTCKVGEYQNEINYGLHPEKQYTLTTSFVDVFGQKAGGKVSFTTAKAPWKYLRFLSLQKVYNVTTPDRTKLTFATENFDYVHISMCKVSPEVMVKYLADYPREVHTDRTTPSCSETKTTKIDLTDDLWVNQYFQFDLKEYFPDPRGQYILTFSHPEYTTEDGEPLYARSFLSVTNLAAAAQSVRWSRYDVVSEEKSVIDASMLGSFFWISDMHTQAPIQGASVSVFNEPDRDQPATLVQTKETNERGIASFSLIPDVVGASISKGLDTAVLSLWADTIGDTWGSAYEYERIYLYSDRPIYRPGQEVFIKGLHRMAFDNVFEIIPGSTVTLVVKNSRYEDVVSQKLTLNEYGTFSTKITLPADAPLGTYSMQVENAYTTFDVAAYVGAAFETKAESDKEEYIAGETVKLNLAAKYYFGVPVDGGEISYEITAQDFYFDRYTDEHFNFGSSWYFCYSCGYGDSYVKGGKATLGENGEASIEEVLDFEEFFKDETGERSKIFQIQGVIKDKQGKTVAFRKSFIAHRGDVYLGVKADPSFTGLNQPLSIRIKSTDIEGKSKSQSEIEMVINKVEWDYNKRQEVDGGYYSRPEQILTPVLTKTISTNFLGNYSEEMSFKGPGQYQIDVRAKDRRGNIVKSTSTFYIYGEGSVSVLPTNNTTLTLTSEKTDVKVGEKARFLIQSPYPKAKALVVIARGRIFTYDIVDITQNIYEYEFPITEDYTPNVYASVTLLSPLPEVKYGSLEFTVDRKSKELTIDVVPDKASYLPGEKVTLTVTTSDSGGRRIPANVSLAVADLSVLALKGNPKKDPVAFFYDGKALAVTAFVNIKNLLEEQSIPTGTKGGDGGSPDDLATKKRGEFKDTAFWQSDVITNDEGIAVVSFTLPDNLTTWQIESVGVTKDTKLGAAYDTMFARKDVMAVPIRPRFIVPGDTFMVGAKIFNQTNAPQTFSISLESSTLTLLDSGKATKTIPSGANEAVYFSVAAPEGKVDGSHTFIFSAKNARFNDTVEQVIPITKNSTYESVATSNATNKEQEREYIYVPSGLLKDRGGLTIKTSATLAVYLSDTIEYLFQYPYGCSEQLASKLSSIAIAKKYLQIPHIAKTNELPSVEFDGVQYTVDQAVQIGLTQVYDNQTVQGGFAYYKGLQPSPYLTAHVLNTLIDLKDAGYVVNERVLKDAGVYLAVEAAKVAAQNDTDSLITFVYPLSRMTAKPDSYPSLVTSLTRLASSRYLTDEASSNALGYLALIASSSGVSGTLKNQVFAALQNRVEIDSRGAYVKSHKTNVSWQSYETPQKSTALLIQALAEDKREYSELPNLLRWMTASRASDGAWGSTNTSLFALSAFTEYMEWKKETSSNFTLQTLFEEKEISNTTFEKDSVLSVVNSFIPIGDIAEGSMHTLTFAKTNLNSETNTFYYDMGLTYHLPVKNIGPRDEGVAISRNLYKLTDTALEEPVRTAKVGEVLRGSITMIVPKWRNLFVVEDFIPAGFELIDFNLDTEALPGEDEFAQEESSESEDIAMLPPITEEVEAPGTLMSFFEGIAQGFLAAVGYASSESDSVSEKRALVYTKFRPDFDEKHDDRLMLFAERVLPGSYRYEYFVRATTPGTFSHLPAVASEMYYPENFGRTAGSEFVVEK